jgi:sugar/nucleoside kinase (ribokinase family)
MLVTGRFSAKIESDSDPSGDYISMAVGQLLDRGAHLVALKRGSRGCLVAGAGLAYRAPALPVAVVDTNGCGDAFVAGFLHTQLRGQPPEVGAALGNALGALTATRYGSAEALPDREQLRAFLAEHHDQVELERLITLIL